MSQGEPDWAMVRKDWPGTVDDRIAALEARLDRLTSETAEYIRHDRSRITALTAHVARLDAALDAIKGWIQDHDIAELALETERSQVKDRLARLDAALRLVADTLGRVAGVQLSRDKILAALDAAPDAPEPSPGPRYPGESDRDHWFRRGVEYAEGQHETPVAATIGGEAVMYEDELPDMTDAEYDAWYAKSYVPDGGGCRVGPVVPAPADGGGGEAAGASDYDYGSHWTRGWTADHRLPTACGQPGNGRWVSRPLDATCPECAALAVEAAKLAEPAPVTASGGELPRQVRDAIDSLHEHDCIEEAVALGDYIVNHAIAQGADRSNLSEALVYAKRQRDISRVEHRATAAELAVLRELCGEAASRKNYDAVLRERLLAASKGQLSDTSASTTSGDEIETSGL